jgi:hypothetical protein
MPFQSLLRAARRRGSSLHCHQVERRTFPVNIFSVAHEMFVPEFKDEMHRQQGWIPCAAGIEVFCPFSGGM